MHQVADTARLLDCQRQYENSFFKSVWVLGGSFAGVRLSPFVWRSQCFPLKGLCIRPFLPVTDGSLDVS